MGSSPVAKFLSDQGEELMSAPHHKLPDAETAIPTFLAAARIARDVRPIGEPPPVDLSRLEQDIERNRLNELRSLLAELTYIEMVKFAAGTGGDADKIHQWSQTPCQN